jgi:D-alanyl-D-alanine dipeptidase
MKPWRLGVRHVLPNHYVRRVPVRECGEPLVDLAGCSVELDRRLGVDLRARRSVAETLEQANGSLPAGWRLVVVEAFRSRARQRELWERARRETVAGHPTAAPAEIDRLTGLVVANPNTGVTNGHQTGGAVDLTLADDTGELWMGTDVQQFNPATATRAPVAEDVRHRRTVLVAAMAHAGFVNYPAEWWHFSLGDQLWAAYSRKPYGRYGEVTRDNGPAGS